jgi:maltokinase
LGTTTDDLVPLLEAWLPRQRWFAGKRRPGPRVHVLSDVALSEPLRHLVVEVGFADGGPSDRYQVPLVVRPDAPFGHQGFLLGETSGGLVYDGLYDPDGNGALLGFLRGRYGAAKLRAHQLAALESLPAHSVGAQQSNTSIVYGDAYILKVFRRLWPGTNPDLEVTLALAKAGSPHVATPLAWFDGMLDDVPTTFGLMQTYLRSATDGWRLAQTSLRDLYDEADLHADEVGGDFAAESERLGAATAEVHRVLATAFPTRAADPEALHDEAARLHGRLDTALAVVGELRRYEADVRNAYDTIGQDRCSPAFQRIHGDLDLSRVIRTDAGWVLIGFEGGSGSGSAVTDRRRFRSPLQDVAGMSRSFDYAARSMLLDRDGESGLTYRAHEWAERNREAFYRGYASVTGEEAAAHHPALRGFELDRVIEDVATMGEPSRQIPLACVPEILRAAPPASRTEADSVTPPTAGSVPI